MKKLTVLLLVLALLLTACGAKHGTTDEAVREITDPGKYTEEEIYAAMDLAADEFNSWKVDATLLTISYDGEARAKAEAREAEHYGVDQVMILQSDFQTGEDSGSFNPNDYYTDWNWIFVKENDAWVLKDWGYG